MRHAIRVALLAVGLASLALSPRVVGAAPFTFLQPGFTQELWAVYPSFLGGVAFAADGDVWSDNCLFSGSDMIRFDRQSTVVVNGTNVHPQVAGSPFPSNAGCGITSHPNGDIYTNTGSGVVRLSSVNGAVIAGPFGPAGDALGISVDPMTNNLVYVGSAGNTYRLYQVDPALTTSSVFSNATLGNWVDGLSFDSPGNYVFLANRSPSWRLTILRRDGTLVQHVPMASEPDGISFHATMGFVVTNNLDGTMTRFDFPGNDYTMVPAQSVFASGGFRGDLSQVSIDGCVYLTQAGARYDNGAVTGENSIVRICGGFDPVPVKVSSWGAVKVRYR